MSLRASLLLIPAAALQMPHHEHEHVSLKHEPASSKHHRVFNPFPNLMAGCGADDIHCCPKKDVMFHDGLWMCENPNKKSECKKAQLVSMCTQPPSACQAGEQKGAGSAAHCAQACNEHEGCNAFVYIDKSQEGQSSQEGQHKESQSHGTCVFKADRAEKGKLMATKGYAYGEKMCVNTDECPVKLQMGKPAAFLKNIDGGALTGDVPVPSEAECEALCNAMRNCDSMLYIKASKNCYLKAEKAVDIEISENEDRSYGMKECASRSTKKDDTHACSIQVHDDKRVIRLPDFAVHKNVKSVAACAKVCYDQPKCAAMAYTKKSELCHLSYHTIKQWMDKKKEPKLSKDEGYAYGEKECIKAHCRIIAEANTGVFGMDNIPAGEVEGIKTANECFDLCQAIGNCDSYLHSVHTKKCYLKSMAPFAGMLREDKEQRLSIGTKKCSKNKDDFKESRPKPSSGTDK